LISQSDAVVLYAPVKHIELRNKNSNHYSYEIHEDVVFNKSDFYSVLSLILEHHIFPEVLIFRLAAYKKILPTTNNISYWAFTKATEWLTLGKVIFKKKPFYCASNSYFEHEQREQLGNEETEYAWDRYRGGLEHMLSKVFPHLNEEQRLGFTKSIHSFVASRMLVGLRLRLSNERNPIDSYYLATRIAGMVDKSRLLFDYESIREAAAIWYLGNDPNLLRNKKAIVLFDFDQNSVEAISQKSSIPVFDEKDYVGEYKNLVILHKENPKQSALFYRAEDPSNNTILAEAVLMNKFI